MAMSTVNIAQAKTQLSALLRRVKAGETIVISERNVPIAELRPATLRPASRRSLEPLWPGWTVPDSFFEPLPDDLLDAFEGRSE
jgi:prevent-host-death family protein